MPDWLIHPSIRGRLVLLLLAILLPLVATLAWFLVRDIEQARTEAGRRVQLLASGAAHELEHRLRDAEQLLAQLAARPAVQAMGAGACDPVSVELLGLLPGSSSIGVRDLQGRPVCGPVEAMQLAPPQADRAAGTGTPAGRLTAGPVYRRAAAGEPVVAVGYAVRDAAGRVRGQVALELDLLALNQHLFAPLPDHAVVTVRDAGRTVLLSNAQPARTIGQRQASDGKPRLAGARQGIFEAAGDDGVARLVAQVGLQQLDWQVTGSLPLAEVLADYQKTLRRTVAIVLVLALLALVLGWRLSTDVARPVAQLRAVAEQVAAGDGSLRSPVGGPPEVQAVARAFNRMLDARALSDSRLRSIFGAATDAIITCDDSQHIVEANAAAARMFRCSLDELIGAPMERFIPVRFRQQHAQDVQRFGSQDVEARRMAPAQREVLALRADGEEFPIEASISQLEVGGGRLYTVIHRDITERRRAEQALAESEARLRRLLTHLPDAVLVGDGAHIGFVNEAACRLFGMGAAALCGHALADLFHADSRAALQARVATLTSGAPVAPSLGLTLLRADGGTRRVQALGTLVDHDGDRAVLLVLRDVTELQRAQAELEASHADLTRLVAELASVQEEERKRIARELHDDLQQTLAAIRMDLATVSARIDDQGAAAQPWLARIERHAEAAIASTRRIINDLRPQILEELGLVAALQALASRFEARHGVSCRLLADGLATDDAQLAPAVSTCLYRVAQEALNNVAKHARARRVLMQLRQVGNDRLSLLIRDDGQGIAGEDLRKAHSFGLLGMRERVHAVQGTLRVSGVPGGGTTLEVELPIRRA